MKSLMFWWYGTTLYNDLHHERVALKERLGIHYWRHITSVYANFMMFRVGRVIYFRKDDKVWKVRQSI